MRQTIRVAAVAATLLVAVSAAPVAGQPPDPPPADTGNVLDRLRDGRPATRNSPRDRTADTGDVLGRLRDSDDAGGAGVVDDRPPGDTGNVLDRVGEGRPTADDDLSDRTTDTGDVFGRLGDTGAVADSGLPPPPAGGAELVPPAPSGGWPMDRYEIYYSEGWVTSAFNNLVGSLTALAFAVATWIVGVGLWIVKQAYSFGVGALLAEPAGRLAETLDARLVGPLRLVDLALFVAVAVGGWQALRGRLARGAGEVAVSLAVLAVAGVVLARPVAVYEGGVRVAAGLSAAVLELAATDGAGAVTAADVADAEVAAGALPWTVETPALGPLTDGLTDAFVAGPYDLLNWGQRLDGRCAQARDRILAEGPHGTDNRPRDLMRATPGCQHHAEWNARPTMSRLLGAGLTAVSAGVVVVVVVLIAAAVIVAQLVGVGLVAAVPLAVPAGVLPGGGRQLLWRWLGAGLGTVAVVVGMAGVLTVMIAGAGALLDGSDGSLLGRFVLLGLLAAAGLVLRRRVLAAARSLGSHLARRLEGAQVGGTSGGGVMGPPAAAAGLSGFGVGKLADEAGDDVRGLAHNRVVGSRPVRAITGRSRTRTGGGSGPPAGANAAGAGVVDGLLAARRSARQTTAAAGRVAARWTVGAPRTAPRAAARATVGVSEALGRTRSRMGQATGRLRRYGGEWAQGAAHPVATYRAELSRLTGGGRAPDDIAAAGASEDAVAISLSPGGIMPPAADTDDADGGQQAAPPPRPPPPDDPPPAAGADDASDTPTGGGAPAGRPARQATQTSLDDAVAAQRAAGHKAAGAGATRPDAGPAGQPSASSELEDERRRRGGSTDTSRQQTASPTHPSTDDTDDGERDR